MRRIDVSELNQNVFESIGSQWMLITAGNETACNTMTASWGGLGIMWNKPSAFVFVRPSRYTYEFTEREETFSLCFFEETYRKALQFCGTQSGRNTDKIAHAGLTVRYEEKTPYFEEADTVLICRKRYTQALEPSCFVDSALKKHYVDGDYHTMYIGEIIAALKK